MALVGSGVIGPGGTEYFDVVLQGGHTYAVDVQPVEPGVDFDLRIYDENGNLITEDVSTTPDAYCNVTPRWTGPFRLMVNSARGVSGYQIQVRE
jgi:hypothetical protein